MLPHKHHVHLLLLLVCVTLSQLIAHVPSARASPVPYRSDLAGHIERHLLMLADEATDGKKADDDDDAEVDEEAPMVDKDDDGEPDEDLKSDEEKFDEKDDEGEESTTKETEEDDDDDDVKSQADKKLLVILLDGFRHDYVQRDEKGLKGLPRLARDGVHARQVDPVHPASAYANYYSIATGLYPEVHGFIDSLIRDRATDELFLGHPHENASSVHWWAGAEPIWVTAEKHRLKTALFGWPGCEVQTSNTKRRPQPSICVPYEKLSAKAERKLLRSWLEKIVLDFHEHRYRLAMVYHESIDAVGHKYGPQSRVTKQAVRDVDEILYDLQDMLVKNELTDEVNIYLVSDHGMLSTKGFTNIELESLIDLNDVELVLGEGGTVQLLAEKGKHSQIVRKLSRANIKGLNVYEKGNVPERFHIKHNRNLLPIYLTSDEGYYITTPDIKNKIYPDDDDESEGNEDDMPKGVHGYDVEFVDEMQAIMYASGPDIRNGLVIEEMEQVDHYNALCDLLGLKPRPNNGSVAILSRILTKHAKDDDDDEDGDDDDKSDESGSNEDDDDDNEAMGFGHCLSLTVFTACLFIALVIV